MAEVRKATDVRLGRTVAVKRLRTDLASDHTFQARFRREAQSSASLNHPSIVAVYDTGEEMSTDGSDVAQPYIVMELVSGRTLRDILREGRKILPERALEITSGVLNALDYSHRAGIIHRDIKPGNVMLTPAGDVKVMDFGIARAISDASNTMTQTAAVVGTAQYLSPEQARGENVDSRSDVYSTGCLLYELLTGRPPFVGESPVSVAYQHVRETAPPPSSLDHDLPPEVDAIVMKALAKPLQDRYQSAAAMRADIDRYLAGKPVQAPSVIAAPEPATSFMPPQPPTHEDTSTNPSIGNWRDQPDEKASKAPLLLLGLLLVAIIAAAAFFGPKLIHTAPDQQAAPSLSGLTQAQAKRALSDVGLSLGSVTPASSDNVAKGRVISQDPQSGALIDQNGTIDIVVSTGRAAVPIPDVVGDNKINAKEQLVALGLKVTLKGKDSDENKDDVINMSPAAGQTVPFGSQVTLTFSNGPHAVPNVVGKTEAEADALITAAGFKPKSLPDDTSTEPKGTVTQQSPDADTTYNKGGTVTILVSTYEPPTITPSPTITPTITPTATPLP
jgi:serine/threonine-protein kinase